MTRKLSIVAAAVIAFTGGTAQAQSWGGEERVSISVPIDDLDLSTPAGEAELDRRIQRAVSRICDNDRDCRDMAWDSVYAQADAAVAKDRKMRRLANERRAQLVTYAPRPRGKVTVITITNDGSPARVETYDE